VTDSVVVIVNGSSVAVSVGSMVTGSIVVISTGCSPGKIFGFYRCLRKGFDKIEEETNYEFCVNVLIAAQIQKCSESIIFSASLTFCKRWPTKLHVSGNDRI
jgi:hypothetical protein